MTSSVQATRESVKKILAQTDLDTKDGISLLSLKHHLMLSYCQALVLLSAHRVLGHTLNDRTSSTQQSTFSSAERSPRGSQAGDLVDSMIENRTVLEKVKALESKMRYQIEKLIRLAEESPDDAGKNIVNDPLAFRPNPQNLTTQDASNSSEGTASDLGSDSESKQKRSGIYRPPKVAPMPYTEDGARSKSKDHQRRAPIPNALVQLGHFDPHMESTSGLGNVPALQSARAKELARMTEFEEENFTRLVMKKKDSKRRRRDEEDLALGGTGAGLAPGSRGRGRRGVGLEDEFADVLKSVNRRKESTIGDGYEELRQRGKKDDVLSRSRARSREELESDVLGGPKKKKGKFEKDQAALKKVLKRKMKR
ncbi:uncharacterized protein FOMMEDRAFT_132513 [Fomitiporia mediterranea MF3/22]|uniref:uncharacterized protein n=1 Tax=Fomitiporia mediterranea (strain MF3/22) TaxID=694068 RepID=UPI0004407D84|nr:uncharacterized protein FOMMEDRAFT_132513 [Fomitiporia mediterranea MF3/22]EJD06128.1 hypothetical protein FOMMEDRAFT_132513 [Fomitiporia mediterranea MF3/22]